ncbi:hypothetical protein [Mesorhizobium sp. M2C.T.Ca.TU.002.02.1.1]|uniref:hypothetical protein n=1 Tax=Mesorhizobium sp. M2C.T.Ca.TU.002.02.1.1 TaxID=2496788 RepID=UPI000FCA0564|nr:hypothetical protein [Mesorhizobium sp. M2C.T.Ca.TU.002.02.1.1]RUU55385.1 hypothetical protein EOD07_18875 [Mesorhizobium sp. M2C.T.Ca.TU.002.02.1.1]
MAKLPVKPKLCFVVGPIGGNDSDDRVHADWLLEEIIKPVFDEHFPEFKVERADKISNPGRIDEQIITALLSAELVIADLTTLNPNAFYEIGIRHAIQKPTIHMHLEGQKIPFDISSFRSIEFSRKWPKDLKAARETLTEFARTATADDYVVDNPVTFSRGKVEFAKTATPSEKIIQDQISEILRRLASIENAPIDTRVLLKGFPGVELPTGRLALSPHIRAANQSWQDNPLEIEVTYRGEGQPRDWYPDIEKLAAIILRNGRSVVTTHEPLSTRPIARTTVTGSSCS